MKYLLLIDFKSVKKILIIYYILIALATFFVYPIAGWIVILFIIRIERDVCKENALMGLPSFYKTFPQKNLYPDEKNLFFYLVMMGACLVWGIGCFMVGVKEFPEISDKLRLIIGLCFLVMIICSIYHISWMHFFFKYQDTTICMKAVSKYYIIIALLILLVSRNQYLYTKSTVLFEFSISTCLILGVIDILVLIVAFKYIRKSYEMSEIE